MNRLGTFILLLDGFDEMKHSMTPAIFRYTFKEILKLVTPRTKVVLAGRPNAFLTTAERNEFLHAIQTLGSQTIRISGQPDFREISISLFTKDQIEGFIDKYRNYLTKQPADRRPKRIPERDEFFKSPSISELAKRPVQLRMLFDVLPAYPGNLGDLTVRELYTFFVDVLIRREAEKPARMKLNEDNRKGFLQNLAFCMWYNGSPDLSVEELPNACFCLEDYLPGQLDAIKRDLISGAFVEVKYPGSLFFPHRSVQEYLVAEFLLSYFRRERNTLNVISSINVSCNFQFIDDRVSPEIFDFMLAAAGDIELKGAYNLITKHSGTLSLKSLSLFFVGKKPPVFLIKAAEEAEPWALAIILAGRIRCSWLSSAGEADLLYSKINEWFKQEKKKGRKEFYQVLFLTWLLISSDDRRDLREARLQDTLVSLMSYTLSNNVNIKKKNVTVQLRPDFVSALLQHIPGCRQEDDPEWPPQNITFHNLYSGLSCECEQNIGLADWFSEGKKLPSLPLVKTINCTDEILRLLVERFDADAVPKRKRKRKRKH